MSATLILVLCMLGQPSDCITVPSGKQVTAIECGILGQIIAQEEIAEHPNRYLAGWRCQIGGGRDA